MKKYIKKIILVLICFIMLLSINTQVKALSQAIQDGRDFLNTGDNSTHADIVDEDLEDLSGYLYNLLLSIGVIVAVVVATVLGIQFMMGGAEGQAKVKEMMIPFVVGCVIVFGGFGIWKLALVVGDKLENGNSYVQDESGNPICSECGDPLGTREQRNGQCANCGAATGI